MLAGGAVTVGLPIFDCLLNDNGTAFADTGAPLPTRFATWFWALGLGEEDWRPKNAGSDYELPPQLAVLNPFKKKLNLFSGSQVFLDGQSNNTHFTGVQGYMTGKVSNSGEYFNSINTIIGDVIGGATRFRSLEVACDGDPKASWTARASGKTARRGLADRALHAHLRSGVHRSECGNFVPDPKVMVRRSALSAVAEQRDGAGQATGRSRPAAARLLLHRAALARAEARYPAAEATAAALLHQARCSSPRMTATPCRSRARRWRVTTSSPPC